MVKEKKGSAENQQSEKVFDYKSDLEKYFERKNFFNQDFSKKDLHKLFEVLIDYDENLENKFASKSDFELLKELNFNSKNLIQFLTNYIKEKGKFSDDNFKVIGKNGSNIESSLELLENYNRAFLNYSCQNEYQKFMRNVHRPLEKPSHKLEQKLNSLYMELDRKGIKQNDKKELWKKITELQSELEIFNSSKMSSYYSLEDLELANDIQNVKEGKDQFLEDKKALYKEWKKHEASCYNLKNIKQVLKNIKKAKRKKESNDRFYENRSNFYNKDDVKLRDSLYFDELRSYWLDGQYIRKEKLEKSSSKEDQKNKMDRDSFLRAIDIKHPFKILEFTVNYELKHIDFSKNYLFEKDKFLNKEKNIEAKAKLEDSINQIISTFKKEWSSLQKEIKNRGEFSETEKTVLSSFLQKWFNNQEPFGKLIDLSYRLRKVKREEIRNQKNLDILISNIESIANNDLLERNNIKPVKDEFYQNIEPLKFEGEAQGQKEEQEEAQDSVILKENKDKTVNWYKENIKLTRKVQDYLIKRANFLEITQTVKEQINDSNDLVFLKELYKLSQAN